MPGSGSASLALLVATSLAPAESPSSSAPAAPATSPVASTPSAPPPRHVDEQGPSPYYYRKPRDTLGWGYRVGLGGAISLASRLPRPGSRFTLDVLPEVDLGFARGRKPGLMLEGGYSFTTGGTHLFVVGAGPAWRNFGPSFGIGERGRMFAALVAHGLVGTSAGVRATGVRTSLLLQLWVVGVEVGHQYLVAGEQRGHELRVMFDLGIMGFFGK